MRSYPIRFPYPSFLSPIWTEGDDLYIKTQFLDHAISLFSYCTIICFSKKPKHVKIQTKKWWAWGKPDIIPFGNVEYIDFVYPKVAEHEKDRPSETYEMFLIANRPFRRVDIFHFDRLDSGNKELAFRCAALITQVTGIRFGPGELNNMPLADFQDKYICVACGHRLSSKAESVLCPYCGGKEIRIE
ncbi:MAG: hypothetical protein ABIL58_25630 [Pseudomonadota bacterium]